MMFWFCYRISFMEETVKKVNKLNIKKASLTLDILVKIM